MADTTSMKKIQIMPQFIYEFEAPLDLQQKVGKAVASLEWRQERFNKRSKDTHLEKRREFQPFRKWVNFCLGKIVSDLGMSVDRIEVTQIWGNKAVSGEQHHKHRHPNSILSCVYYATDRCAPTRFYAPNIYNAFSDTSAGGLDLFMFGNGGAWSTHEHYGNKGTMVVFPSTLQHDVGKNDDDLERITLAINTFPAGYIGDYSMLSGFER